MCKCIFCSEMNHKSFHVMEHLMLLDTKLDFEKSSAH